MTKEFMLPVAVVIGLLGNALFVGTAWGRYGERLDRIDTTLVEVNKKLVTADAADFDVRMKLAIIERDLDRLQTEHRLLKDFVEGRISHLPYRK